MQSGNPAVDKHSRMTAVALFLAIAFVLLAYPLTQIYNQSSNYQQYLGQLTIFQFSGLALCMLAVWWSSTKQLSQLTSILVVGIILRLLLIPTGHYTSNDVDRYLFDGYIAFAGFDPYTVNHAAPQFAEVINDWAPPQEHLKYVTLYPPVALALFTFAASFGAEFAPLVWKTMTALASIAVLLLSYVMLKKANKLQHLPLVALSPILILEAGVGAHIDIFASLFVVLCLYFFIHQRLVWVGIAIGLGTLVKLFPLVLAGPLFLYVRTWSRKLKLVTGLFTTLALGYGSAFFVGWTPVGSVGVFFEKFRFGSPFFTALEHSVSPMALFVAVIVLLLLGYTLLAVYTLRLGKQQNKTKLYTALQCALSLPLLIGPVVYPWYLMSLIPVLAMSPNRWLLAWTLLLPLTYEVLSQWVCCQIWQPKAWPMIVLTIGALFCAISVFFNNKNRISSVS